MRFSSSRPFRFPNIRHHREGNRAFTLFELLTVVAIMAIMAGLIAPALSSFKAVSLSAAGSRLTGLADLARQNSISKSTLTALVMSTATSNDDRNRAFAIFELVPKNDGSPATQGDWKQLTPYEVLQTGTVADVSTWPDQSVPPPIPFPVFTFGGKAAPSYQYALFTSTGGMLGANPTTIRLVEGTWPAGASVPNYTHPNSSGGSANYFQIYFLPSNGLHKIERP